MDAEYLKTFSNLTPEEKRQIINTGRPTPELRDLKQQKGTKIIRKFQTCWYNKFSRKVFSLKSISQDANMIWFSAELNILLSDMTTTYELFESKN